MRIILKTKKGVNPELTVQDLLKVFEAKKDGVTDSLQPQSLERCLFVHPCPEKKKNNAANRNSLIKRFLNIFGWGL